MNTTVERPYLPASAAMNWPSGAILTPPNSSNFVKYSTGIPPLDRRLVAPAPVGALDCGVAVACANAPVQQTTQNKKQRQRMAAPCAPLYSELPGNSRSGPGRRQGPDPVYCDAVRAFMRLASRNCRIRSYTSRRESSS